MEELSSISSLMVRQQKEWTEILTSFETKNKYATSDESGRRLYWAAEEAGFILALLLRWFFKALRPFTIAVLDEDGQVVLRVVRPFRFFFHRAEVLDAQGQSLGMIKRRFSIIRRIYTVRDPAGDDIFQLFGPLLRPWTFQIRNDGVEYGKITKQWSGLLTEGFTDADTFGVMFPAEWDVRLKALFLGAVFLIDFVHFENKRDD